MDKLEEEFSLVDTHTGKVVSKHTTGQEALKAEKHKNHEHFHATGQINRYKLASGTTKTDDGTKFKWSKRASEHWKFKKPTSSKPKSRSSSSKSKSDSSSLGSKIGKALLKHGLKSLFREDEMPVNNAGDGSNVAGLDKNPGMIIKKKRLRDVIRRL